MKEAKISRMNDDLDKKRKGLQVVEEDLVERKIKIEDEERKLKVMKDGLEQKAKEFDSLFKEDEEKLKTKIEELDKFLGSARPKQRPEPTEDELKRTRIEERPHIQEAPRTFKEPEPQPRQTVPAEHVNPQARPKLAPRIDVESPEKLAKEDEIIKRLKSEKEAKEKEIDSLRKDAENIRSVEIMKEMPREVSKQLPNQEKNDEDIRQKEYAMMEAMDKTNAGGPAKGHDDLLKLMQKDKRINVKTGAKILGVTEEVIVQWSNELKEQGILNVHPKFMGGTELELTKDAIRRLKELEEEEKVSKIKNELERIREEQKKMKGSY